MRKDVKIGLASAGVLVVLLVVYAIVPHNKSKTVAQTGETPQVEVGPDTPPTEPETPAVTETPTVVTPLKSKDPFGAPTEPRTPKNGDDVNHPADVPPAVDAPSTPNTNWGQILTSGQLPKAEKGAGAPPLFTTVPTSPTGTSPKTTDTRLGTDSKTSDIVKPERPLYGSDSPTRGSGSTSETPPLVPAARAGASSGSGERTHVIQKGETLSSISEVAYGTSKLYTLIQKANPDLDDRRLKVGATIKIPERSESSTPTSTSTSRKTAGSSGSPALAGVQTTPGSTRSASTNSSTEYRVQAGDTLYGIAVKLYGKGSKMNKLHDANKATLGDDPDSLKIGMVLKLPETPTVAAGSR